MGVYLNPGNEEFASILRSPPYVDKSGLIAFMNERLGTPQNLICHTRPRRFGKTFAAQMLVAYYTRRADSQPLFDSLSIAKTDPCLRFLNQADTIFWDIARFASCFPDNPAAILPSLCRWTNEELIAAFPDVSPSEDLPLAERLLRISTQTGRRFFILIDEWDVLFREAKDNSLLLNQYRHFLSSLFQGTVARRSLLGAYLTGILPISCCGAESALTDFEEFTMTSPGALGEFIGFTQQEVKQLCHAYDRDFSKLRSLYEGYLIKGIGPVYNPLDVRKAVTSGECQPYWTPTASYESLRHRLELPLDGLSDAVIHLLTGGRQPVDVQSFRNNLATLSHRDDVLSLLVHLGYLGYDQKAAQVFIPNEEIREEFLRTFKKSSRPALAKAVERSDKLLKAVLNGDEEEAGLLIDEAHNASTSPTFYNNEQALRSVIILAFLSAVNHYHRFEEIAGGRGYVDLCFIPLRTSTKPPLLVELKWNKTASAALEQVKEKKYADVFRRFGFSGREAILVGVNYAPETGKHDCRIERTMLN